MEKQEIEMLEFLMHKLAKELGNRTLIMYDSMQDGIGLGIYTHGGVLIKDAQAATLNTAIEQIKRKI